MTSPLMSRAAQWLQLEALSENGLFKHRFDNKHIGNIFIRSIHGGVSAGIAELSAQMAVVQELGMQVTSEVSTNSVNYLRVTKAQDIYARTNIVRLSRRLAIVDVKCWQDEEDKPITSGQCTLRIFRNDNKPPAV